MIRFSFFLICLSILMDVSGQEEKYITEQQHFRIPLNNRTNKYLKILPSELLKAYATGKIKAYYPLAQCNELNFGDFISHFNWGEPFTMEDEHCGDNYLNHPAYTELFSRFESYLDYYSYYSIHKQTGLNLKRVDFIQLVYTVNVWGKQKSFRGPLFRLDEVNKVLKINNPNDPGEPFGLQYLFDQGRFFAFELLEPFSTGRKEEDKQSMDYQEY